MKKIQATNGTIFLIDDQDAEFAETHKWRIDKDGYPARVGDGKRFHILIMKPSPGNVIHHKASKLDARRENLEEMGMYEHLIMHAKQGRRGKKKREYDEIAALEAENARLSGVIARLQGQLDSANKTINSLLTKQ